MCVCLCKCVSVCVGVGVVYAHARAQLCRSEESLQSESVFFKQVSSQDQPQGIRLKPSRQPSLHLLIGIT